MRAPYVKGVRVAEAPRGEPRSLARTLLLVLAVAVLGYLVLVDLASYVALIFASILAAVALVAMARKVNVGERLPHALCVVFVLLLMLGGFGGLAWWFGPDVVRQFGDLFDQLPQGIQQARRWVQSLPLGRELGDALGSTSNAALTNASSILKSTGQFLGAGVAAFTNVLIFIIVALFLAMSPQRYFRGAMRLLPPRERARGGALFAAIAAALRRWLLARVALMLIVAVLFGVGLLIVGVRFALPLALIAGLFSFVPYVGPILALIPALAVSLLDGPARALYVLVLYAIVQLVESYLIEPLVEAQAVALPPALIIVAQVVIAVWIGPFGVVIATPLLVVMVVTIQVLYLRDTLGDEIQISGQGNAG